MEATGVHEARPGVRAAAGPSSRRPWWPYVIFVLLGAAFCRESLLPGRVLLPTNPDTIAPWLGEPGDGTPPAPSNGLMNDAFILTLPGRVYNHERLRAGEIPFWNPSVFCGYPHFALIQNNALYPLSAPFDAIDPYASLAWSTWLHLAVAGGTLYAFLRRRGLDPLAATVGGAAFELNGMFLVRASAPSYLFSGVWLPLLLIGATRLAGERRLRSGWPVFVGTALSVLGGHPQISSLALTVAGAWLLWCLAREPAARGGRGAVVALACFALLVALGVGLAGFQVVPFLELMRGSARGEVSLAAYRTSALPFAGLLQAIVPEVFGHPVDLTYWFAETAAWLDGLPPDGRFWALNFTGGNLFTGVAPLFLAAVAVTRAPRRHDVLFFAAAALASLGVLLGTPLLDVAYALVPGFRYSRPDRISFVYMAAVSVLAGHGAGALADRAASRGHASTRRVALAAAVIVLWPVVPRLLDGEARQDLIRWLADATSRWAAQPRIVAAQVLGAAAVFVACLVTARAARRGHVRAAAVAWGVLVAVPLLLFGWRYNPVQRALRLGGTQTERLLLAELDGGRVARILSPAYQQFLPANAGQLVGLRDVNGASAAGVGDFVGLIDAADRDAVAKHKYFRSFRSTAIADTRLLDLVGARLVLSDRDLPDRYRRIGGEDGVSVYRNPGALPRFFVVRAVEVEPDLERARRRVLDPDFDPATTAVLERALDPPMAVPPAGAGLAPEGAESAGARDPVVNVERDDPLRIELRVEAPERGVLIVTDALYPGWEARVDGVAVETLRADAAFRGVALAPGTHRVEMFYVPRSFRIGVGVTLVSLAFAVGIWGGPAWRRTRRGGKHA